MILWNDAWQFITDYLEPFASLLIILFTIRTAWTAFQRRRREKDPLELPPEEFDAIMQALCDEDSNSYSGIELKVNNLLTANRDHLGFQDLGAIEAVRKDGKLIEDSGDPLLLIRESTYCSIMENIVEALCAVRSTNVRWHGPPKITMGLTSRGRPSPGYQSLQRIEQLSKSYTVSRVGKRLDSIDDSAATRDYVLISFTRSPSRRDLAATSSGTSSIPIDSRQRTSQPMGTGTRARGLDGNVPNYEFTVDIVTQALRRNAADALVDPQIDKLKVSQIVDHLNRYAIEVRNNTEPLEKDTDPTSKVHEKMRRREWLQWLSLDTEQKNRHLGPILDILVQGCFIVKFSAPDGLATYQLNPEFGMINRANGAERSGPQPAWPRVHGIAKIILRWVLEVSNGEYDPKRCKKHPRWSELVQENPLQSAGRGWAKTSSTTSRHVGTRGSRTRTRTLDP